MEFLYANFLNTTTQMTVSSNTVTAEYLFTADPNLQYYTDGFNNDNTTASITITFDTTTNVSRIVLRDINLKEFRLFYNGATANSFNFTNATSTSYWTTNSSTAMYLRCATTAVSSITIDMKSTITANSEKVLGFMAITDTYYSMDRIPDADGFKPTLLRKQVVHELSDGGSRVHNISQKTAVNIKMDYVSATQRESLRDIFNLDVPFGFCPFGTSTGWDEMYFDAVWTGAFEFYEYTDNAAASGFSGTIRLKETSW